jgi:hypothetical protein
VIIERWENVAQLTHLKRELNYVEMVGNKEDNLIKFAIITTTDLLYYDIAAQKISILRCR